MQCFSSIWYSMVFYGTACYYMVLLHGTIWYFVNVTAQYCVVLHFIVLYYTVCYCILGFMFIEALAPATCISYIYISLCTAVVAATA